MKTAVAASMISRCFRADRRDRGHCPAVHPSVYAVPRTAILGAVLLTGFYGGAVASKVRIEDPLFSSILFGVYFGPIAWGGLYLRDERLRSLFPFRR